MQLPRLVATAALLAGLVAASALGGCAVGRDASTATGASPAATPSPGGRLPFGPGPEPRTLPAAVRLAEVESDRYIAGDYAGAWALWTSSAQRVFSRAQFAAYHAACPGGRARLAVTGVRLAGPRTAVVRMGAGDYQAIYTPRYERGHWRWQPTDDDLAFYRLGVAGAIRTAKAQGGC